MSYPRSSTRPGQEGAIAISIGVVLLLLVAAGLLALLLTAKPKAAPPTRIDRTDYPDTGEVQMPADGYRLVWRAREDGTGAPTLALFLRPNDAVEVTSSRIGVRKIVTGSETWQRVVVPGIDSLRADPAFGPAPCSESSEPFAGCASTGVGTLTLKRGDSTTERYAALEELRLPTVDPDPRMRPKEPPQLDLRIFRTEPDPQTRRLAIRSWSCLQGAGLRLVPAPSPGCDPAPAGAGRSAVLFECGGGFCRAHFLYQQRLAELLFEFVPATAAPEMRMRLFLTAWEMLNRQQADASRPVDVEFDRAETLVQVEACRHIAQEASRWLDAGQFRVSNGFDLWHNRVARSCQRVEKTALRFAKSDPVWASGVLGKLLDIYRLGGLRVNKDLHEARFAMLEQGGAGETMEMFDAMVNYLRHDGFAGLGGKDPVVPRAHDLARKLKLPAADPRVLLVRERLAKGQEFQDWVAENQRQRQRPP